MATPLDFRLCPNLDSSPLFYSLPVELERSLEPILPQTFARLEAALKFGWFMSAGEDIIYAQEPRLTRLREAFLRAGLAEFSSASEALVRDLKGSNKKILHIQDCPEPHIRIMKELRNLEIHLHSSQLSRANKDAILALFGSIHETQAVVWTVEPLTEEKFNSLHNAKYYSADEIKKLIEWFNKAQGVWGVDHLLYLAVCSYATKLQVTYLSS